MNRCYCLIWNQVRQLFMVVPENTRGCGKAKASQRARRLARLAVLPLSLVPALATAMPPPVNVSPVSDSANLNPNPTGGVVTVGEGSISQTGNTTTIDQHSQNLSLDWQSFSIGTESTVDFVQPNTESIAVNRILGNDASVILGHLNANGQVFLINANGVLFGQSAQVNVGGLVASTLDVDDSTLGSDSLHFSGNSSASVVNLGAITAASGGYVALLGHQASNQGVIRAQLGTVALAGGNAVTLNFNGNQLVDIQVDQSALNALAENHQLIVADGGQVLMSAGARDSLLASVVNNTGVIQAQTVENRDGTIILLGGMAGGTTNVAGTLDASAPTTGDGGFIETSAAHVKVADGARITTLASNGNTGSWLIDPQDYSIAVTGGDISGTTLSANLGSSNIEIQSASGTTAGSGDIHVNDEISWSADTTLTLTASNDINVNADITATGDNAGLVLNPNTTNGTDTASGAGEYSLTNGASITLSGLNPLLQIAGNTYTVINSLGVAGDTSANTLQGLDSNLTGYYALGSDIDASATAGWNGGLGFDPIGSNTTRFTGIFDGFGHTISGLTINRPAENYVGLFGFLDTGAEIRGVGLLGGAIIGGQYVGGLVGRNYGTISQSWTSATVTGNGHTGGLAGYNNEDGTISQSWAAGAVTGNGQRTGGLVGFNRGIISQSYASGAVSSSGNRTGGLVGINNQGDIIQSYATGAVSSSGTGTGGLAGQNFFGTITDSYWDTETTGQATSAGGTGLTTEEMMDAGSFAGWDMTSNGGSTSVWRIYEGHTAPLLRTFMTALEVTSNNVTTVYSSTVFTGSNDLSYGTLTPSAWLPSITTDTSLVLGSANTTPPAEDAGSYILNDSPWSSQLGYDITYTAGILTIDPLAITVDATASDKAYDATTAAMVSLASGGIIGTDVVSFTGTSTFDDKNAGTGKTVTVTGISASGADAGNYSFNATDTGTADISPLAITVDATASDKVYDATTVAVATANSSGVLAGDTINFTIGNASFDDKNAGVGKTVTVTGISASGVDAGNYSFNTTDTGTASISPATLTYAAMPSGGTYVQVQDELDGSVVGFVGGETLVTATTGTLAWSTPATTTSQPGHYAITGGGLTANFGNYNFVQAVDNATALNLGLDTDTDTDTNTDTEVSGLPAGNQGLMTALLAQPLVTSADQEKPGALGAPRLAIIDGGVKLAQSMDKVEVEVEVEPSKVQLRKQLAEVLPFSIQDFPTGAAIFGDGSLQARVQLVVDFLIAHPNMQVVLEGNTDNIGAKASNQTLSEARAEAVARALVSQGVDASQLIIRGVGASNPVASNSTKEGRGRNRRVLLKLPASI